MAVEVYVETFPNIARDRFVWPTIERAIRRRFEFEGLDEPLWRSICLRNTDGRNQGSIARIVDLYDGARWDAKQAAMMRTTALPDVVIYDADVHRLLGLLEQRLSHRITQADFEREANALSGGG